MKIYFYNLRTHQIKDKKHIIKEKMRFNNSVDNRNKDLLDQLEDNNVQIDFEIKNNFPSWAIQARPKYVIVAPNDDSSPESLAHELLHIKLNILGFIETSIISDIFKANNCRFATSELSNIQNILAHLKMLPEFIQMGYPLESFVMNDGQEFFIEELLPAIVKVKLAFELHSKLGQKQSITTITQLLKIIIELKQCEIENSLLGTERINTEEYLEMLRQSDRILVTTLYEALTSWVNSGSYSNYDFYINLNLHLAQLGFPNEENWENWEKNIVE